MRVILHPADDRGCGSYRLIWPGQALAAQGYDVTVDYDFTYRAVWKETMAGESIVNLDQVVKADVVVFQRVLHRNRFELIQVLQSKGVAVVVEVDDDFHAIHKRNAAWRGTHLLNHPDHHRDWLKRSCEIADLVTTTTPALAQRYGSHGRVAVLPNCVPEHYLSLSRPKRAVPCVGWSGSVDTHPGDLEVTQGALRGFEVKVVGTGKGVKKALRLDHHPPATGWLPLADYPKALAELDIGIVPLRLGPFNEAKSALKGLEMAAVGVPFVASPTGPYLTLHEQGAGLIAATPTAWRNQVKSLVDNPCYRMELAEKGQEVARQQTYEANSWRWWQAYQWALMQRRQAA